jgi:hypothetical protein
MIFWTVVLLNCSSARHAVISASVWGRIHCNSINLWLNYYFDYFSRGIIKLLNLEVSKLCSHLSPKLICVSPLDLEASPFKFWSATSQNLCRLYFWFVYLKITALLCAKLLQQLGKSWVLYAYISSALNRLHCSMSRELRGTKNQRISSDVHNITQFMTRNNIL